jgi:hypothetical protein
MKRESWVKRELKYQHNFYSIKNERMKWCKKRIKKSTWHEFA